MDNLIIVSRLVNEKRKKAPKPIVSLNTKQNQSMGFCKGKCQENVTINTNNKSVDKNN